MLLVYFMVMVTIVLASALVYILATTEVPKNVGQTPRAGATTSAHTLGFQANIIDTDKEIYIGNCEYRLYDASGKLTHEGRLMDIYQLDLDATSANFSYLDVDQDGYLSSGDTVVVRSLQNGGLATIGGFLQITVIVKVKDGSIVKVSFSPFTGGRGSGSPVSTQLPWLQLNHDQENITLEREQSAVDRTIPISGQEFHFLFSFNYTGQEERDAVLRLTKGGEVLHQRNYHLQENESFDFRGSYTMNKDPEYRGPEVLPYGTFTIELVDNVTGEQLAFANREMSVLAGGTVITPSFSPSSGQFIMTFVLLGFLALKLRKRRKGLK